MDLVEEYWLLTTGTVELSAPTHAARVGLAIAALLDLERRGEVRWREGSGEPVLDPVGDCRCPAPRDAWHRALVGSAPPGGTVAARFTLDPFMQDAWRETAEHLVSTGLAVAAPRRRGRSRYTVTDPAAVRRRRAELLDLVPGPDTLRDLPRREFDLLTVGVASDSLSDLFRVHGVEPPARIVEGIVRSTQAHPSLPRLEAAAAFTNAIVLG